MMITLLLTANTLLYPLRLTTATGSFPKPLSAQEEQMYLERSAQGDLEARNILVERNLRLVAHILKKYYAAADDQDDLISIGTIGLIKAISTFDSTKGARLATYAGRCIQNAILSQMSLSFQVRCLRVRERRNGVFWHNLLRKCTYFVGLMRAM
jgi:RNA polymerase sporulation-specific sigma factor